MGFLPYWSFSEIEQEIQWIRHIQVIWLTTKAAICTNCHQMWRTDYRMSFFVSAINSWSVFEINSIASSVCADNWTAEWAVIASDVNSVGVCYICLAGGLILILGCARFGEILLSARYCGVCAR